MKSLEKSLHEQVTKKNYFEAFRLLATSFVEFSFWLKKKSRVVLVQLLNSRVKMSLVNFEQESVDKNVGIISMQDFLHFLKVTKLLEFNNCLKKA